MQKKNIDELFRDKLSDFKQTPDNKVWRAIDASLNKKKKKRIIPLWWSFGGIAAAIMIGLLVFNPFTEKHTSNEILVDTDNESKTILDIQPDTQNEIFIDSIDTTTNAVVEQNIVSDSEANSAKNKALNNQQESNKISAQKTKNSYNRNIEPKKDAIAENNKNVSENSNSTN